MDQEYATGQTRARLNRIQQARTHTLHKYVHVASSEQVSKYWFKNRHGNDGSTHGLLDRPERAEHRGQWLDGHMVVYRVGDEHGAMI